METATLLLNGNEEVIDAENNVGGLLAYCECMMNTERGSLHVRADNGSEISLTNMNKVLTAGSVYIYKQGSTKGTVVHYIIFLHLLSYI